VLQVDDEKISQLNVQEYRKHLALVSQEPACFLCDYVKISWSNIYLLQTLYVGTVRFSVLLGATKPKDQVTQEELEAACRDANILDFTSAIPLVIRSCAQAFYSSSRRGHIHCVSFQILSCDAGVGRPLRMRVRECEMDLGRGHKYSSTITKRDMDPNEKAQGSKLNGCMSQ
jgi:hypothetical protein